MCIRDRYKNDIVLKDNVLQYYYQPGGLSGNYYVVVFNKKGERGISNKIELPNSYNKSLNIYPNPSNTFKETTIELNLSDEELIDSHVIIYSVKGVTIQKIENLQKIMTFQLSYQGTYIVQLQSKNGEVKETKKIIVSR